MSPKFVTVAALGGGRVAVLRDLVALAVPARDEKQELVIGTYVLLPTGDAAVEPLAALCRIFGLAPFAGVGGELHLASADRFAASPGAVARVTADPGLLGTSVLWLRVPNVVPKVQVRCSPEEAAALLNAAANTKDDR